MKFMRKVIQACITARQFRGTHVLRKNKNNLLSKIQTRICKQISPTGRLIIVTKTRVTPCLHHRAAEVKLIVVVTPITSNGKLT